MKTSFYNDYSESAHPDILRALAADTTTQEPGYGLDAPSREAADLIRRECGGAEVDVHFVSGGTQANLIVCAAALRPYESIISCTSGHIALHEAGAIEATGHKIEAVAEPDGKLTVDSVARLAALHTDEHMTRPRMLFVSQATELGTVYSKDELAALSRACRELGLLLYVDGARIGSALASGRADMTLADVTGYADAFYIGGTKNGALFGEAIVIVNPSLKTEFRRHMKQRGALLAKGRALGVQFRELFRDGLFYRLASHANEMARVLGRGLSAAGVEFAWEPTTNQIFPRLPNSAIKKLEERFGFYVWMPSGENHSVIRLVTSWATREPSVHALCEAVKSAID